MGWALVLDVGRTATTVAMNLSLSEDEFIDY